MFFFFIDLYPQPWLKSLFLHVGLWWDLLGHVGLEDAPPAGQEPTGHNHQEHGAVLHTANDVLHHGQPNLEHTFIVFFIT